MLPCDERSGRAEFIQRHGREAPGAAENSHRGEHGEQKFAEECLFQGHVIAPYNAADQDKKEAGESQTGLQDFNGILKQLRMFFEELAIRCNKSNPAPKQNGKLIQKRNLIEQRKMLRRLEKELQIRIVAL